MDNALVISNEEQAWRLLEDQLAGKDLDAINFSFESWPVIAIRVKGEDFNGTIPTRFFEPILEFQSEIQRVYTRLKYGHENIRKLTRAEREALELVVQVRQGSADWQIKLTEVFQNIVNNMTSTEKIAVIVTIGLVYTTTTMWSDWLEFKEKEHGKTTTVKLSEQETKRVKLITETRNKYPDVNSSYDAMAHFRSDITRKLKPDDEIELSGKTFIEGDYAAEIIATPQKVAQAIRIDGEFYIDGVKFPKEYGGKYRLSVENVKNGSKFFVDASPDQLNESDVKLLREASFAVQHVLLQINANELHGKITKANLVSIKKVPKKEG